MLIAGGWISWRAPQWQMHLEESAKDRVITEGRARLGIRVLRITGPLAVAAGLALCAVAFSR